MNIFWLSLAVNECAKFHCDKHVVKMILEYTQLLYSAHHIMGNKLFIYNEPYKLTHKNHPCSVWVRQSRQNYKLLYMLLKALCNEYTTRYGKIHSCEKHVRGELAYYPSTLPDGELTLPPLAMPAEYKRDVKSFEDVIAAYRTYYIKDKSRFAVWKNGTIPKWFVEN